MTTLISKLTDLKLFREHTGHGLMGVNELDTFISCIKSSCSRATRFTAVPAGHSSVDADYERLRAIRRRAERRYRRTGRLEDYKKSQATHIQSNRHMQKLGRKKWHDFCNSLTPFTPLPKIWQTITALSHPVSQRNPFRALAISLGIFERDVSIKFCKMLT